MLPLVSDTIQAWLDNAPEWILNLPQWAYDICYDFFKSFIYDNRYLNLVTGLQNTLILTFFALMVGLVLGVLVALIRVSWDKEGKFRPRGIGKGLLGLANTVAKVYLTVIRGTPVVIQIMIIFFVIMANSNNKLGQNKNRRTIKGWGDSCPLCRIERSIPDVTVGKRYNPGMAG